MFFHNIIYANYTNLNQDNQKPLTDSQKVKTIFASFHTVSELRFIFIAGENGGEKLRVFPLPLLSCKLTVSLRENPDRKDSVR